MSGRSERRLQRSNPAGIIPLARSYVALSFVVVLLLIYVGLVLAVRVFFIAVLICANV